MKRADVQLVLLRYPLDFETFMVANLAIQSYATDADVPLVDTARAMSVQETTSVSREIHAGTREIPQFRRAPFISVGWP